MGPAGENPRAAGWLAAIALIAAAAAIALAAVALGKASDDDAKSDQEASMSMDATSGMSGMDHGSAGEDHMAELPMDGITDAKRDDGGTRLSGVRRNGALAFELEAKPVWWRIYGEKKLAAWSYNGIVLGPTIRVRNGERVRIRFRNSLPKATTVHWHGIGVPNSQDGVLGVTQQAIEPGESFTYEFTVRSAGRPDGGGTLLYHSHQDEDRQMPAGLYGTFVIDPPAGGARPPYEVEKTLVFSEWTADGATGRTRGVMDMDGMKPNFFTINGKSFPDTEPLEVRASQRVLLRLVNAGQFAHPIHLHGTSFEVVAKDGHPLASPERRDAITLSSGERADVLFTLPKGKWALHCHIGHHLTNDGEGPGGLLTTVEARGSRKEQTMSNKAIAAVVAAALVVAGGVTLVAAGGGGEESQAEVHEMQDGTMHRGDMPDGEHMMEGGQAMRGESMMDVDEMEDRGDHMMEDGESMDDGAMGMGH